MKTSKPTARPSLTMPQVHVVTVLVVASVLPLQGCPTPTAPGACFTNWAPPAGTPSTIQSTVARPTVSLAPCPEVSDGINPQCMTAQGCSVFYNIPNGQFPAGTPAGNVVCPATTQCLWGITAAGAATYGPCPNTDQPMTFCANEFRLDDPRKSGFVCESPRQICTMASGSEGMLTARVNRFVTGEVVSTACPSPCEPFA